MLTGGKPNDKPNLQLKLSEAEWEYNNKRTCSAKVFDDVAKTEPLEQSVYDGIRLLKKKKIVSV